MWPVIVASVLKSLGAMTEAQVKSEMEIRKMKKKTEFDIKKMKKKTEFDTRKKKKEAKIDIRKIEKEAELDMKTKEKETELHIKKETEIEKILMEIDQLRKDKEFNRDKEKLQAIENLQKRITEFNLKVVNNLTNLKIEVARKVEKLVQDETENYNSLHEKAWNNAALKYEQINKRFPSDNPDNEIPRKNLMTSASKIETQMIDSVNIFIASLTKKSEQLASDLKSITDRASVVIEQKQVEDKFKISNKKSIEDQT